MTISSLPKLHTIHTLLKECTRGACERTRESRSSTRLCGCDPVIPTLVYATATCSNDSRSTGSIGFALPEIGIFGRHFPMPYARCASIKTTSRRETVSGRVELLRASVVAEIWQC